MAAQAQGTVLKKGSTAVAQLTSIGGLDLSADTIDVTHLTSTDGFREFIAGWKDGGEVSISGWFYPADAGQAALLADFLSGAVVTTYQIEFPTAINKEWNFSGIVTKFTTGAELEDAVTFESTIKVTGVPSLVAKA